MLYTFQGITMDPFLHRGEQFDAGLGMYYQCSRYYLPRTGRFLTTDRRAIQRRPHGPVAGRNRNFKKSAREPVRIKGHHAQNAKVFHTFDQQLVSLTGKIEGLLIKEPSES